MRLDGSSQPPSAGRDAGNRNTTTLPGFHQIATASPLRLDLTGSMVKPCARSSGSRLRVRGHFVDAVSCLEDQLGGVLDGQPIGVDDQVVVGGVFVDAVEPFEVVGSARVGVAYPFLRFLDRELLVLMRPGSYGALLAARG